MTAAELYAAVAPWLNALSRRLAKRYRLDPDELHQESALRVVRRAHTYDSARSKPSTWAAWQARSAASQLSARAAKGRRCEPLGDGGDEIPDREPDAPRDPLAYARFLPAALATLPSRHRLVLELRHTDGHDMAEVGRRLGVSRQRAFQLEAVALKKLRAALLDLAHPPALTA